LTFLYAQNIKQEQPENVLKTTGQFEESQIKFIGKKDAEMKEFLEKSLGGGRVLS